MGVYPRFIVPVNNSVSGDDIAKLVDLGARQFFFGFMPSSWVRRWGWELSTNRRAEPFLPHVWEEKKAKEIIRAVHRAGARAVLAVNEHMYTPEQLRLLMPIIQKAEAWGIDGMIVGDPALILALRRKQVGVPVILSIGGGAYNNETVDFFYQLGVRHFVLPRKMHPKEIRQMIEHAPADTSFEVFLLGGWCRYSDDHCYCPHGYGQGDFCSLPALNPGVVDREIHPFLHAGTYRRLCGVGLLAYLQDYWGRIHFKLALRSNVRRVLSVMERIALCVKDGRNSHREFRRIMECRDLFCGYDMSVVN